MLAEVFHNKAVQYVSGEMSEAEQEAFEVLLEADAELAGLTGRLRDAAAMVALAGGPMDAVPDENLKKRVLESAVALRQEPEVDALVTTDAGGRIVWANAAFTAMCGYRLEELKGRKPGSVLQGPATDGAAVGRIRDSMRAGCGCRETLVNYHKDGSAYRVYVRIAPVLDEDGRAVCFVARERELAVG